MSTLFDFISIKGPNVDLIISNDTIFTVFFPGNEHTITTVPGAPTTESSTIYYDDRKVTRVP